jgi:hypothetical protein
MFYLPYTLATKNVLKFNINKVLSINQENDNLFTPRPLFDGIDTFPDRHGTSHLLTGE